MFREIPNLKDSSQGTGLMLKDNSPISLSYTKTNKLIAGLYMVTDIMDKDEPIRARLRALGSGLVSDTFFFPSSVKRLNSKIYEIMSFLDIASTVGLISQMNASILKKEFTLLQESIEESTPHSTPFGSKETLAEFMKSEDGTLSITHGQMPSMGQVKSKSIGVQKGHTLLKAIKDMSDRLPNQNQNRNASSNSNGNHSHATGEKFDVLKKERREKIVKIIRSNPNGTSIKDIVLGLRGLGQDMGEKTLQRELISMVKDRVLNKTGEKRWSRYFVS
jgi:hypothetical protein